MAFLGMLVLVGIVLAEVKKTLVWSRPNAGVFKVGWFWASEGSKYNDHISPWAELWWTCYSEGLLHDRGHTSTHPVREKIGHFHSLVICNVSLKWNSYSSWFWSQYLDCIWHFWVYRRLILGSKGTLQMFSTAFMICGWCGIIEEIVNVLSGWMWCSDHSYLIWLL